jgi:hypothetical protein
MLQQTRTARSKACLYCGEPFPFHRVDRKTCSRACKEALKRYGPQKFPGDAEPVPWHPRSLVWAIGALEKGVPLGDLILEEDERAATVAAHVGFPLVQRLEAAGRLLALRAPWVGRSFKRRDEDIRLDERARRILVLAALEEATESTTSFGTNVFHRRGRPKKYAPYVPAEEPWGILLRDFLERALEAHLHDLRDALKGDLAQRNDSAELSFIDNDPHVGALSLDAPIGEGEEGEPLTLGDVISSRVSGAPPEGDVYFRGEDAEHGAETVPLPFVDSLPATRPEEAYPHFRHGELATIRWQIHRAGRASRTPDELEELQMTNAELRERLERLERGVAETNARLRLIHPTEAEIRAVGDEAEDFLAASACGVRVWTDD